MKEIGIQNPLVRYPTNILVMSEFRIEGSYDYKTVLMCETRIWERPLRKSKVTLKVFIYLLVLNEGHNPV